MSSKPIAQGEKLRPRKNPMPMTGTALMAKSRTLPSRGSKNLSAAVNRSFSPSVFVSLTFLFLPRQSTGQCMTKANSRYLPTQSSPPEHLKLRRTSGRKYAATPIFPTKGQSRKTSPLKHATAITLRPATWTPNSVVSSLPLKNFTSTPTQSLPFTETTAFTWASMICGAN